MRDGGNVLSLTACNSLRTFQIIVGALSSLYAEDVMMWQWRRVYLVLCPRHRDLQVVEILGHFLDDSADDGIEAGS